jgi:hypothetical protein
MTDEQLLEQLEANLVQINTLISQTIAGNGVQEYSLNTGQTITRVTRTSLIDLQKTRLFILRQINELKQCIDESNINVVRDYCV